MTDDQYLSVEDVAARLGLPLGLLLRRVEAGDVPARRIDGPDGTRYELSLRALGIELPVDQAPLSPPSGFARGNDVPQEFRRVTHTATAVAEAPVLVDDEHDQHIPVVELRGSVRDVTDAVDELVPPPSVSDRPVLTVVGDQRGGPLSDIASMSIDPRELVAGLLDRWERTLEQRIYAEQRQRFEAELTNRQNLVKQLQMELKATRAEHAATVANSERALADRERLLEDRARDLQDARRAATEASQRKRGWFFRR